MGHHDETYVIFDADHDMWAYTNMKGWQTTELIDFRFHDGRNIARDTAGQPEDVVKQQLRDRLTAARQVIVLVGERTRQLATFAVWELEVAIELGLPIIAVNIDKSRVMDPDSCPALIQYAFVVHVAYEAQVVKHALDNFPDEFARRTPQDKGPLHYTDDVYTKLGV